APWIDRVARPTRRILPFRFHGQPCPAPLAVGIRFIPGDAHTRLVCPGEAVEILRMSIDCVALIPRPVRIRPPRSLLLIPPSIDELPIIRVRYVMLVDPEPLRKAHLELGLLIGGPVGQ